MLLTDVWDYILEVAQYRLESNLDNPHNKRMGNHTEVLGVAGEIATRRFLGRPEIIPTIDEGWDIDVPILFPDGEKEFYRLDVKSRPWVPNFHTSGLQWPIHKAVRCDAAVLVFVHLKERRAAVTYIASAEQIRNAPITHAYRYPCRLVKAADMYPATRLYNILQVSATWRDKSSELDPVALGLISAPEPGRGHA